MSGRAKMTEAIGEVSRFGYPRPLKVRVRNEIMDMRDKTRLYYSGVNLLRFKQSCISLFLPHLCIACVDCWK